MRSFNLHVADVQRGRTIWLRTNADKANVFSCRVDVIDDQKKLSLRCKFTPSQIVKLFAATFQVRVHVSMREPEAIFKLRIGHRDRKQSKRSVARGYYRLRA